MSAPGLAKGVIAALADKVRADARADAGRGYRQLATVGERAAKALAKAAETIPGRGAPGMEKLAAEVGDLRYDALTSAIAGFVLRSDDILRAAPDSAFAFRAAVMDAADAVAEAWDLSAAKMGLKLDGTPLPKKPEAPPIFVPVAPVPPKRSAPRIAASF